MEIINTNYKIDNLSYALEHYFDENTVFFDIECTGLSPRKSYIYMIGYALRLGNCINITQLLAKNESEELEIIKEFENVIQNYERLLGFNSTRFDEHFIIERCRKYKFNTKIKSKKHIDMYLATTKAKCLINLPNYKQKTIEQFLGLNREDKYNGGELIPVYMHYSILNDLESKDLILLHNLEDIKGMISIVDILTYKDLLNCDLHYVNHNIEDNKLRCEIKSDISIPNTINKSREYGLYIIKHDRIYVTLNLYKGELNYYLPDYKNYYYIASEDMIIPKSLGENMDKNERKPASKKNCKVKKEGLYLQLPLKLEVQNKHIFKASFDAKEAYIDVNDISDDILIKITKYMLKH